MGEKGRKQRVVKRDLSCFKGDWLVCLWDFACLNCVEQAGHEGEELVRNLLLGYRGFCVAVLKQNCIFFQNSQCLLLRLRGLDKTQTIYRGKSAFPESVNSVLFILKMPSQQHVNHHKIKYHTALHMKSENSSGPVSIILEPLQTFLMFFTYVSVNNLLCFVLILFKTVLSKALELAGCS